MAACVLAEDGGQRGALFRRGRDEGRRQPSAVGLGHVFQPAPAHLAHHALRYVQAVHGQARPVGHGEHGLVQFEVVAPGLRPVQGGGKLVQRGGPPRKFVQRGLPVSGHHFKADGRARAFRQQGGDERGLRPVVARAGVRLAQQDVVVAQGLPGSVRRDHGADFAGRGHRHQRAVGRAGRLHARAHARRVGGAGVTLHGCGPGSGNSGAAHAVGRPRHGAAARKQHEQKQRHAGQENSRPASADIPGSG